MYSSWKFLIDCSFKYPTCLSFHPQFLAMGASSVFILLLSGAVTFPSSLLFVCAAIGLCTFTSGYVTVGKILSVCLKETFYLKMKIQSLSSRLHADGKSGESPEALRSQMNLRRCYLQPLHMLRAYWGLFPAADEYTFGALVVVMKEYVAQCSSVALLCVVNSFFLTTTEFSYFSNTDFTVYPQSCMKSSAILLEVQTQRCLFRACKENMELIFGFRATFVDWRIVPTKSLVTFS